MDLLRAMRAFVATVQTGSMTAAAAELGLSPAMVGQHLAALEERLGTRLLHRTTRRQSVTDFGASYFEQCRDILERVAASEEAAVAQRTRIGGRLRLTAPITFGTEALMPALAGYRDVAPDVDLDVTLTDRVVDLVEEGFDLAFRLGALPDSGAIARPLRPYRMAVAAAPAYLARAGTPSHPRDLAGHQIVAFTPAARAPWRFARDGEEVRIAPPRKVTVNSGRGVQMAALAGLGIVVQPEILMNPDFETGRLVRLFADWSLGERPLSLVYYRDRRMTPRLRSFIAFAVATFGPAAPEATPV